jgi:dihydroflavonol-4-reductase
MKEPRYLLIGGSGFIGRHLLQALKDHGVSNIACASRYLPQAQEPQVHYYDSIDITKPDTLKPLIQKDDIVINLAGLVSFYQCDQATLHSINHLGALHVLELCQQAQVQKLVHLSSTASFGFSQDLIDENTNSFNWKRYFKILPYSYSKHLANHQIHHSQLPTNIIFPSLVLGPGDKGNTAKLFEYVNNNRLILSPPGSNGFIDVRDLARLIVKVATESHHKQNFIASSQNIAFSQILNAAARARGQRSRVLNIPSSLLYPSFVISRLLEKCGIPIPSENIYLGFRDRRFKSEKAQQILNFTPIHSIDTSLLDAHNHQKQKTDRYLVIYNKYSGRKRIRNRAKMIQKLFHKNNIYYHFVSLKLNEPICDLAIEEKINNHRINKVLVIGGDGTFRRAAQYFVQNDIDLPIGFFPIGSTNLIASTLTISYRNPARQKSLLNAKIKKIPIATLNDEIFLMAVCYGNLALISAKAHKHLKNIFGFLSYVSAAIYHGFSTSQKEVQLTIDHKDSTSIHCNSIVILLTHIAKSLIKLPLDESKKFQIIIFQNKNTLNLIGALFQLYIKKQSSKYVQIISADQINITGSFGEDLHLDGDVLNDHPDNFRITTAQAELKILV